MIKKLKSRYLIFNVAILAICLITFFFIANSKIKELNWTGDEPRYTYFIVGLSENFKVSPSAKIWEKFTSSSGLTNTQVYIGDNNIPAHSLIGPLIYSPFQKLLHLDLYGVRFITLIFSLISIILVYFTTSKLFHNNYISFFSTVSVIFTNIYIAYSALVYMEIILAFLISILCLVYVSNIEIKRKFLIMEGIIFLLPVFHLRTAVITILVGGFLGYNIITKKLYLSRKFLVFSFILGISSALIFYYYQTTIFGSIFKSATYAVQPTFFGIIPQLMTGFFSYRHGLLTYAPSLIFAILGLIYSIKSKYGLFFLLIFIGGASTLIWGTASESYSGRFWVFLFPIFIIGLGFYLNRIISIKTFYKYIFLISFVLLQIVSFWNSILFIEKPVRYLENREYSVYKKELNHPTINYLDKYLLLSNSQERTVENSQEIVQVLIFLSMFFFFISFYTLGDIDNKNLRIQLTKS